MQWPNTVVIKFTTNNEHIGFGSPSLWLQTVPPTVLYTRHVKHSAHLQPAKSMMQKIVIHRFNIVCIVLFVFNSGKIRAGKIFGTSWYQKKLRSTPGKDRKSTYLLFEGNPFLGSGHKNLTNMRLRFLGNLANLCDICWNCSPAKYLKNMRHIAYFNILHTKK